MMDRIYLEVTSRCNYRCAYCPHPNMLREKRHMDEALARRALEQIASGRIGRDVWLNCLGEPGVVPCCVHEEGELVLGNIQEQRLHTILRSPRARAIRQGFANNRVVMRKCQECLGTPKTVIPSTRRSSLPVLA